MSKKEKKNTELGFLNARKFHYRTDAMEDVDKIDTAISIIYYVALISCVKIPKTFFMFMILFISVFFIFVFAWRRVEVRFLASNSVG